MASIHKEISLSASPAAVWDVVRDIGAVHAGDGLPEDDQVDLGGGELRAGEELAHQKDPEIERRQVAVRGRGSRERRTQATHDRDATASGSRRVGEPRCGDARKPLAACHPALGDASQPHHTRLGDL